ncbi:cytochrome P450 [Lentzea sp. NPDC054927]
MTSLTPNVRNTLMKEFPFAAHTALEEDADLRELRESDPVCRVRLISGGQAWLVTRYDDVRAVEADPRFSRELANRPGTPTVWEDMQAPHAIINMDPPRHDQVRRLMSSAFSARRVAALEPRVRQIVAGLLDDMQAQGPPADLVRSLATPLPLLVIGEVLGMPRADQDLLHRWMNVLLDATSDPSDVTKAFSDLNTYIADLITAKRAHPGDDVLTAMITAAEDGRHLSEPELQQNAQNLIFAGQDTTAGTLANSVITLFRNPGQLALLRDDLSLADRAVEELLRFVPVVVASPTRIALEDVHIGGVTIPAGDAVLTVERSANKDATAFDTPEVFDITRKGKPHLGFGHGTHYCLGSALARLELTTALTGLLERFPRLRPAADEVTWLPNRVLYTVPELPVTW